RGAGERRGRLPGRAGVPQRGPPRARQQVRRVPGRRRPRRRPHARELGGGRGAAAPGHGRQRMPLLLVRLPRRGGGALHPARTGGRAARAGALVSVARAVRVAAVALLRAGGAAARAQDRPPDPADLINAVLGGLLGFKETTGPELQDEVAEVGGVPFRAPVPLAYLSPADLAKYLKDVLDDEYPPGRALADQRTLIAFDLLPSTVDLRAVRAHALEEHIAGFYDERPGHKRLYAVSEDRTLTPANQLVLSHELRHAMQDQYADVHGVVPDEVGDFDDRRLAFVSLLEGDATLVMERFLVKRLSGAGLGTGGDLSQLSWPVPPVPGVPSVV